MRFMKFLALGAALFAIAAPAHATGLELPIGNAIFAGLYSIGLPGAVANFVANNFLLIGVATRVIGGCKIR
ncbi:hypothetical protein SAMN05880590_1073 [Rhizobium sp. RU35A]|uniref:hypothetical protein n=1 Tax=Rhizobium sp. RU35A TaxID=1907414 RepID=UPI0009569A98|nr:hypothetical protein [Rhizobium sp. RU35A]SIQ75194.1 hypothetical protein SAMN05880590_1073 [Rhizobium sp. RU35A]